MNDKVYIHEYIDIIGHNRGRYMYHMTANWSPAAQEDRHQLCYGVWGVVGSTGRWPQVVNVWEEDGFDGLARSFGHELGHRDLQDPKLAAWWAAAAELRAGGVDRLLVPAPWMPTIEQVCSAGIRGAVYAHEQIQVPREVPLLIWTSFTVTLYRSCKSSDGFWSEPGKRPSSTTASAFCCGLSRHGRTGPTARRHGATTQDWLSWKRRTWR